MQILFAKLRTIQNMQLAKFMQKFITKFPEIEIPIQIEIILIEFYRIGVFNNLYSSYKFYYYIVIIYLSIYYCSPFVRCYRC